MGEQIKMWYVCVCVCVCVCVYIYIYIYNIIRIIHKKEEILPFATAWIDLEVITLSEIDQVEK